MPNNKPLFLVRWHRDSIGMNCFLYACGYDDSVKFYIDVMDHEMTMAVAQQRGHLLARAFLGIM